MTDEKIIDLLGNKIRIFWDRLDENIKKYLQNRFNDNSTNIIKESYLRIKYNIKEIPKCPICGKPNKFRGSINDVYADTCGDKHCINKLRMQNIEKYNLENYGVKNTWQREDVKNTCKKIWLKNME